MGFTVKETPPLMKTHPDLVRRIKRQAAYAAALLVVKRIRWNIMHRGLILKPKSVSWAKRSLDKRPLINTRQYVSSLRAVKLYNGAAIDGDFNLMTIHEFGTADGKIPARPHIEPSLRQIRGMLDQSIGDAILSELAGRRIK